ncbi:MerR family transcriptional regulator [Sphingomonas sp. Sphisp140]|uniref:MerR family transcriptional regulator n=1 Tax=unclassified Sphingomonas TaxID=196159 RepID=UPI0039AF5957
MKDGVVANSGPNLRTAEVARRLGVSVKALRLYEAHGLVKADRTAAGWRVYGPEQIARLHHVMALKSFGFSLSRIAALVSGGLPDLSSFLALQERVLREEARRVERALHLIAAARAKIAVSAGLSPDYLINLTKEITMNEKSNDDLAARYERIAARHLSASDQAELATNGAKSMLEPDAGWEALHAEATRLMETGDPHTPEAVDLARRWMNKVFEATNGDPILTRKVKAVARDMHDEPAFAAASSSSNAMMDFVSQAYGAAIAAGIMPKPAS